MSKDYYKILEVSEEASVDEIKKSYRKLAMEHHPDKSGGDEEKFKEISEAYEVLSDDKKRKNYDQFGDPKGGFNGTPHADPRDIFSKFFSGNSFDSFFKGAGATRRMPADVRIVYTINLEDILKGAEHEIQLERSVACDKCRGNGNIQSEEKCEPCDGKGQVVQHFHNMVINRACPECSGTGLKTDKCLDCSGMGFSIKREKLKLKIPKGLKRRSVLKVSGHGNEVYNDSEKTTGNVYVIVEFEDHKNGIFVHGEDIYTRVRVPYDSVLSEKIIDINVLDCQAIKLKLNPNKETGYEYTVKNGGINKGYAFVQVFVDVPKKKISKNKKEKLAKLLKEIYGEPTTTFQPSTNLDTR